MNKIPKIPKTVEEGYKDGINDYSDHILSPDVQQNTRDSLSALQADFLLFTPVLFYRLFPKTAGSDPLGQILGNKFTLIQTDILPVQLFDTGPSYDADDFRIYGVVKEQADDFTRSIRAAICRDTPKRLAYAMDFLDVRIDNLQGGFIIVKYIKMIGNHYTYAFLKPQYTTTRIPQLVVAPTEEWIVNNFQAVFDNPADLFNQTTKGE